jgi:Caspase domain.
MRGRRKKFGIDVNEERNILLAACRENQTSADAFIGGGYHGAFTYFLVETIKELESMTSDKHLSYRRLVQETGEKLEKNGFEQIPQLEGQERYFNDLFLSSIV